MVLSVMVMPPFLRLPQTFSVRLRSSSVLMVMSSLAVMERLPEVVELSARVFWVAEMFAARLLKLLPALMDTEPPWMEAVCSIVEVMLLELLALSPIASW